MGKMGGETREGMEGSVPRGQVIVSLRVNQYVMEDCHNICEASSIIVQCVN